MPRRKPIIIGGPKKKTAKKAAKKRPSKRVHARTPAREPAAMPAQAESKDDRVRRAVERVQAEGRIDTAQLAAAMKECRVIRGSPDYMQGNHDALRNLMVTLADMIADAAFEMKTVRSKNIEAVGYDHKGKLLRVVYQGGRSYDYVNVPPETVADLWVASSVGSFIHQQIKPNHPALAQG